MSSKDDVAALFNTDEADDMGVGGDSSDILIANLNATTLPMCVGTPVEEIDTDDVTIVMFAIDRSPSMEPVRDLLIETFNEVMIGGLKGASRKTAATLMIGGLSFSSDITPLWGGGFQKLEDLPLLTRDEYDPNSGRATNLYQAQLDALTAAASYSTEVFQETGTPPKVIVVGLSDGADNHWDGSVGTGGADPAEVKKVVDGLSKELWTVPMAVFETWEQVDGRDIARKTGFDVFEFKKGPGESDDDVRRRFRHMVGTMSSSLIKASTSQVGTSQSAFWQPQL